MRSVRAWRPGRTCSSTGVSRPKIDTRTLSLWESTLISEIDAGSVANGPSMTVTDSPTSKSTVGCGGRAAAALLAARGRGGRDGRGEHAEDLVEGQRDRVVGGAEEAGDPGRVPDRAPRLVGEVHAHEHVGGDPDPADLLLLPVLDLGHLLHGDLDLVDVLLHVEGGDARLEVGLHAVLVAGVAVHDEPLPRGAAQLGAQLLDRVRGGRVGVDLVGRHDAVALGDAVGLVGSGSPALDLGDVAAVGDVVLAQHLGVVLGGGQVGLLHGEGGLVQGGEVVRRHAVGGRGLLDGVLGVGVDVRLVGHW